VLFITVAFVLYGMFGAPFLFGLIIFLVATVALGIRQGMKNSKSQSRTQEFSAASTYLEGQDPQDAGTSKPRS
jgi:hypothetical protein